MSDRTSHEPIIRNCLLFTRKFPHIIGNNPKTRVNCVKSDPTESPISISPCPNAHDIIELNISDTSVPIETKVIPIIKLETPRLDARAAECLTAILLENIIRKIFPIRIINAINIFKIVFYSPLFNLELN